MTAASTGTPTAPGSGVAAVTPATGGTLDTPTTGTAPTATATTPEAVKDKRRTSFFGSLGGKKERTAEVGPESEVVDGESRQKSTPTSKLGGLFRRPSRAAKGEKDVSKNQSTSPTAVTDSTETPVPISKDTPAATTETPATHDITAEPQANGIAPAQSTPVQTTA